MKLVNLLFLGSALLTSSVFAMSDDEYAASQKSCMANNKNECRQAVKEATNREDWNVAYKLSSKGCQLNEAVSCLTLGLCKIMAFGTKEDKPAGIKIWTDWCKGGEDVACSSLGKLAAAEAIPAKGVVDIVLNQDQYIDHIVRLERLAIFKTDNFMGVGYDALNSSTKLSVIVYEYADKKTRAIFLNSGNKFELGKAIVGVYKIKGNIILTLYTMERSYVDY